MMKTYIFMQDFKMNKDFYKKKKSEIDRIIGSGALFTLIRNSILIFSFLFLLGEIFNHPQILNEDECFHHLSNFLLTF